MRFIPFMYFRRASGTTTDPSAFWYCSRMASIFWLVARAVLFSVWTNAAGACPSLRRYLMFSPQA